LHEQSVREMDEKDALGVISCSNPLGFLGGSAQPGIGRIDAVFEQRLFDKAGALCGDGRQTET
jgi:hypothetical protein